MKNKPSRVLTIFKTHLDIGFTDYAQTVLRRYMEDFIPGSLRLAKATRHSPHRFVWTTGSWLAYRYLEDAGASQRRAMEQAIGAGDFHWHALPFTAHTELMDAGLFDLSLRFSEILDERFGRKTIAAKMTDVPGHTKGIVPLLAAHGVRLLHIGVNPASSVPDVPSLFTWKVDGAELVVAYDKVYGATKILPGGLALSVNLTGDNLGPQNPSEIEDAYANLQKQFPGAEIVAGSLDEAAAWLWERRKSLPVFTGEIGDTWIHGTGTDPAKISRFRALSRLRSKWIASGALRAGDKRDLAFGEQLLLVAEHTWGMDIKTHLADERNFSQAALRRSLAKPNFKKVAKSWAEQRAYLDAAVKALPAKLQTEARGALQALKPKSPAMKGSRKLKAGEVARLGKWEIALYPVDGSIRLLREAGSRRAISDEGHRLAAFGYQTFSAGDIESFVRQYSTINEWWVLKDFGKPGLSAQARSAWHSPSLAGLWLKPGVEELIAELRFSAEARRYGAPAKSTAVISAREEGIDVRLQWFEKPANRMPEAFWMHFNPRVARNAPVTFEKLGVQIDPRDVVNKGNRQLHAVTGPAKIGDISISSLDAPLIAPGEPRLLEFTQRQSPKNRGVFFNLYNNVWGTNFPAWYSDDALFRFELRLG